MAQGPQDDPLAFQPHHQPTPYPLRFTAVNYDRRGRGTSGDTPPYAVRREIEDLEALVTAAGGSAHLDGVSSGGALVLEAAAAGVAVDRIAVYEVPYDLADDAPRRHREYVARLEGFLAGGRRGEAAELFMRLAGASDEMVAGTSSPGPPTRSRPPSRGANVRPSRARPHMADPEVLAQVLARFFTAPA